MSTARHVIAFDDAPDGVVRVASLEDDTVDAPTGEPGELMVRGPLVMLEYFGNPEATAETITADGWLLTGDIAYADAGGYFYIVDRRRDMIDTAGYNVYPAEIERVLLPTGCRGWSGSSMNSRRRQPARSCGVS